MNIALIIIAATLWGNVAVAMEPKDEVIEKKEIKEEVDPVQERIDSFLKDNDKYIPKAPEQFQKAVCELVEKHKNLITFINDQKHVLDIGGFCANLKKQNIPNTSSWSVSIPFNVGNKTYFLRLPSPLHKRENWNAQRGEGWNTKFTEETLDKHLKKYGRDTYQTISRFTGNIEAKKIVAENNLSLIELPNSYLFKGTGDQISDQTSVVVDEWIPNCEPLGDPEVMKNLNTMQLAQLCTFIKKSGLWSVNHESHGSYIKVNQKTGKLILVNLQQPNTTAPDEFLKTPEWRFEHNSLSGFEDLHKLLTRNYLLDNEFKNKDVTEYKKTKRDDLAKDLLTHVNNYKKSNGYFTSLFGQEKLLEEKK
jgi:hypothetical protein